MILYMCICVYTCTYIYIYIYIVVHTCTYTYTYIHRTCTWRSPLSFPGGAATQRTADCGAAFAACQKDLWKAPLKRRTPPENKGT